MKHNFEHSLLEKFPGRILLSEDLKKHTSFKIGGKARIFFSPQNLDDLKEMLSLAKNKSFPIFVIGNGTNILVDDDGIPGVTISLKKGFSNYRINGTEVTVGAGMYFPRLLSLLGKQGLGGLELLCGIPGCIGGVVSQNAGAGGMEICQFIKRVKALDEQGNVVSLNNDECEFSYRKSCFQGSSLVILEADLEFQSNDPAKIFESIRGVLRKRKGKMPLNFPSAGSIFKKPKDFFAGKLIEEAGFKGFRIGDAMVSEKHANFIVNMGNARSDDVKGIISNVRESVYEKSGIMLEREILFVPEDILKRESS